MQIQTYGPNGPTIIAASHKSGPKTRRPRGRKPLHLPLALEARTPGAPMPSRPIAATLSGHELRRIVAVMLG